MTGIISKLSLLVAIALVTALGVTIAAAQNPKRPKTQPTTQQRGDTTKKQDQLRDMDRDKDQDYDRDRDRDRDKDQDYDRDRDRDRDRLSRPMTAQEKEAMEKQVMRNHDNVMAVGYRQNMLNFALNLRQRLEAGGTVDRDLARNTVKEMKRNFEQMEKRHKNQKKEMGAEMRERMSYMFQEMEEHQNRIRATIRDLENDAAAKAPNSRQMIMHLNQLEEQIREMERARAQKNVGGSVSMNTGTAYVDVAVL